MDNKKKGLILGGLILIWALSAVFSSNTSNKNKKNTKIQTKKKLEKKEEQEEKNEELDMLNYTKRKQLSVEMRRNIFEYLNPEEKINTEQNNTEYTNEYNTNNEENTYQNQENYQNEENNNVMATEGNTNIDVAETEIEKLRQEMMTIEYMGFYKRENNIIFFLKYKEKNYEFTGKGEVTIFVDGQKYDVIVELLPNEYLFIVEKTKKIYVTKKI